MRGAAIALAFIGGVATGVIASCGYFKKKYRDQAEEEIASVKEVFSKREKTSRQEPAKAEAMATLHEALERAAVVIEPKEKEPASDDNFVSGVKKFHQNIEGALNRMKEGPYVIKPEEYDDDNDYEKIELTYYADRIVTDEDEDIVECPEVLIGEDFASHFGEYEDDAVYIRNDERGSDYMICKDERSYAEVEEGLPNRHWGD